MVHLDWKGLTHNDFEELCTELMRREGFKNVKRMSGPGSGDRLRDIHAEEYLRSLTGRDIPTKILVQCKNYRGSRSTISSTVVEKLALRTMSLPYNRILIITSHDLSSPARNTAHELSENPNLKINIECWTESDLIDKILNHSQLMKKYFPNDTIQPILEEGPFSKKHLVEYSTDEFVEKRPIFKQYSRDYLRARLDYEASLIERYYNENLITWKEKKHPITLLFSIPGGLMENQVNEIFEKDIKGDISEFLLPQVVHEWNYSNLLAFMLENPLIKRGKPLYDGQQARLKKIDHSKNSLTIYFQKTNFFKYLVTNLAMDVYSQDHKKTLRDKLEPGKEGKLKNIEQSQCGGGFGIGCYVFSKENDLILSWRSKNVSNAKLTHAPSAGGGLRLRSTSPENPPSIFEGVKYQLWSEMAVEPEYIKEMIFLGVTRELERGGKTDGHFYVELDLNNKELVERRTKAEHFEENTRLFPVKIEAILDYLNDIRSSPALRGGVYLLNKYLKLK